MGEYLLTTLVASVFMMCLIDVFTKWYRRFLKGRKINKQVCASIIQIMWVFTALILWNSLFRSFMPVEFDVSHVLFALFVYTLRGLVMSVFQGK